jgi:hypothetical protein
VAASLHSERYVPDVFTPPLAMPEDHQSALRAPEAHSEAGNVALPENAKIHPLTLGARVFLVSILIVAVAVLANAIVFWHSPDLIKFGAFLSISLISAGARVRVPGVTVPLPLSYLFVLLGLVELTAPETILLACGVALVQSYWNQPKRPATAFVLLQVGLMIAAAGAAERVYHSAWF